MSFEAELYRFARCVITPSNFAISFRLGRSRLEVLP